MSASINLAAAAAANAFTFDGTSSTTFKCIAYRYSVDNSPEKGYTAQAVPGSSGDILLDNRRFANVEHVYQCIIYEDFDTNFAALKSFLLSRSGYCRLSDTTHTDEFYHAYYMDAIEPTVSRDRVMGKFTLVFRRKPQRWLVSGETAVDFSGLSTVNLTNPTYFYAAPFFDLYLSGLSAGAGFYIKYPCHSKTGSSTLVDNKISFNVPSGYASISHVTIDTETMVTNMISSNGTAYYYNKLAKYEIGEDVRTSLRLIPNAQTSISKGFINSAYFDSGSIVKPRWYRL